jgi:hypothetical protein
MRRLMSVFLGLAMFLVSTAVLGQGNPRGLTSFVAGRADMVSIEYGRPSLHGKTVQDRLGADKSTTLSTAVALVFGGVTVPKGEYSLWGKKGSDGSWKLVFNKQHGQWGTEHDPAQDAYSVPLEAQTVDSATDMLNIDFSDESGGGHKLTIQWGNMQPTTTFKTQ